MTTFRETSNTHQPENRYLAFQPRVHDNALAGIQ